MNWLKARWSEPSTRAGLAAIALVIGGMAPPGSVAGSVAYALAVLFGGHAIVKADR